MNIHELLYQEESSTLDFKEEQYKFINENNKHIKGELLKDILAFANAWRESDAYIIIGVREVKGGKSEVVGIDDDIDDASLQEFINKKTNRPLDFKYCTMPIDEKKIAYIQIPIQKRPFYVEKEYGNVKANIVYLRRGSSTDIAAPDEVSDMGVSCTVNDQSLNNPVDYRVSAKLIPIQINHHLEYGVIEKDIEKAEAELVDLEKSTLLGDRDVFSVSISPMSKKTLSEYKRELGGYKIQLKQYIKLNKEKLERLSKGYLLEYVKDKYFMKLEIENNGSTSDTNIDVSVGIENATIIQDSEILSYSNYLFEIKYPQKPSKNIIRHTPERWTFPNIVSPNQNAYMKNIEITNSSVSVIIGDMNVGDNISLLNFRT